MYGSQEKDQKSSLPLMTSLWFASYRACLSVRRQRHLSDVTEKVGGLSMWGYTWPPRNLHSAGARQGGRPFWAIAKPNPVDHNRRVAGHTAILNPAKPNPVEHLYIPSYPSYYMLPWHGKFLTLNNIDLFNKNLKFLSSKFLHMHQKQSITLLYTEGLFYSKQDNLN
jgi:hypothetical protein